MIEPLLAGYAEEVLGVLFDPRKRLFVGYLAAALLIAIVWLRLRTGAGTATVLRGLFARRVWWGASARADYGLALVNHALMLGLAPVLLAQMTVATSVFYALHSIAWLAPGMGEAVSTPIVVGSFTAALFVLDDLSRYALHRALHRVPVLWAFHKVHHGARTLTPVTVYRTHPVENVAFALRATVVQALVIAAFTFAFGERVDLATVLGVNVALFVFNAVGSNLRHSHVPFGYPAWLEGIVMSPAQHQIHHSSDPRHHDRNFGAALSVWDAWGGSLQRSRPGERLRFGLSARPVPGEQRLVRLYLEPFAEAYRHAVGSASRLRDAAARLARTAAPGRLGNFRRSA